jgi:hypothetical protein
MSGIPHALRDLAEADPEIEALIQRSGDATWDLIAVGSSGDWQRGVFLTREAAADAAGELGFKLVESWEDGEIAKRVNSLDAWSSPIGKRRAV